MNDQIIAGLAGNLKRFLAVHGVEREHVARKPQRGDQRLRRRHFVGFVVDDLVREDDLMLDGKGAKDMRRLNELLFRCAKKYIQLVSHNKLLIQFSF